MKWLNITLYDVKLSNSQLNKWKLRIKNSAEITLKISANVAGDSNDENNFPHKFFLTCTQLFRKCFCTKLL